MLTDGWQEVITSGSLGVGTYEAIADILVSSNRSCLDWCSDGFFLSGRNQTVLSTVCSAGMREGDVGSPALAQFF